MTEMRILTVRQPWAWAIIHGGKDVENRVRNIAGDYRGPVAIHVGLAYDNEAFSRGRTRPIDQAIEHIDDIPYMANWGAIIGVVDLVGVHRSGAHYKPTGAGVSAIDTSERACCPPWGEPSTHHLELANPRPLATPILYKGALGLRRLDAETVARVLAQTGDTK